MTTEQIAGRAIDSVIGEVVGLTARTLNPFSEGIKRVDGLSASREMVPALLRWRRDAIANLAAEAELIGADAVVGMKFDNRILSSAWTEICAYGTAVLLVPSVYYAESSGQNRATALPSGPVRSGRNDPARYLPGEAASVGLDVDEVDPAGVDSAGVDTSGSSGGSGDGT